MVLIIIDLDSALRHSHLKSANFQQKKNQQINDQSTLNHKKKTINDNHKIIKK